MFRLGALSGLSGWGLRLSMPPSMARRGRSVDYPGVTASVRPIEVECGVVAFIDQAALATIAAENQRMVDIAKGLLSLTSSVSDPNVSGQLQDQVETLLNAAERISQAITTAK